MRKKSGLPPTAEPAVPAVREELLDRLAGGYPQVPQRVLVGALEEGMRAVERYGQGLVNQARLVEAIARHHLDQFLVADPEGQVGRGVRG